MVPFGMQRALLISLILYTISLYTSMAGMEFFAWLTFLLCAVQVAKKNIPFRYVEGSLFVWGLVLVVLIGMFVNVTPEMREQNAILGRMRWVLTFYSTALVLGSINIDEKFLKFLNYFIGVIAVYSIVQIFTGIDLVRNNPVVYYASSENQNFFRSTGLFSMPTTFAHSIGMFFFFPFALFFLDKAKSTKHRIPYLLTTLFVGAAIIGSFTRGAYIALFIGLVICAFLIKKKLAVVVFLFTMVLSAALYFSSSIIKERAAVSTENQKSVGARMNLWKANWAMFKDYPFFGIGYVVNEDASKIYFQKLGIQQDLIGHAHNNYLNFLSSTGIFGFLLYLGFTLFFLTLTYKLWQKLPPEKPIQRSLVLGAFGAQLYFHICGLTDCNFTDMEVNHQFLFILALISGISFKEHIFLCKKGEPFIQKP